MSYKSKLEVLQEILPELKRLEGKIEIAMMDLRENENQYSQSHTYAAARRAALDLKKELTKLTQDSKYRYGNN